MAAMTRAEALNQAILAAMDAHRPIVDADMTAALARLAQAWLAIHDRLPEVEQAPRRLTFTPPTSEQDIQICGHDIISWRLGDHWVHAASTFECDDPPITNRS